MALFRRRKAASAIRKTRVYGFDKTWHGTEVLDVEVRDGEVVAVWFRCQPLPFKQADTDETRAQEMRGMYRTGMPALLAVTVKDD